MGIHFGWGFTYKISGPETDKLRLVFFTEFTTAATDEKTVILLKNGEFSASKVFFYEKIKSKMMKIKFDFYYSLDLLNKMRVFFSAQRA